MLNLSKIGRKPVRIGGVTVFKKGGTLFFKKGIDKISVVVPQFIMTTIKDKMLNLLLRGGGRYRNSMFGLYRSKLSNIIKGLNDVFVSKLEVIGVDYKVINIKKRYLKMNLGFSHDVLFRIPKEIDLEVGINKEKTYVITMRSFDKDLLGMFSSKIRSLRRVDPYKGKGVKYQDEFVVKKKGKTV